MLGSVATPPGDAGPSVSADARSEVRVRIVSSRGGAGHTQVAAALRSALEDSAPGPTHIDVVDALKEYAPFPFNYLPDAYALWCERAPSTYGWFYRATNGRRRSSASLLGTWPFVRSSVAHLLTERPLDAVVCVHTLENHFLTWSRRSLGLDFPIITMVTDPIDTHAVWVAPDVDLLLVGSEKAKARGERLGIAPERVRVTGQPVNPRFIEHLCGAKEARATLGWDLERPTVLLVGGGDGVGNIEKHAKAIDASCRGLQIAIVAGRNRRLSARLRSRPWNNTVHLYGFVDHVEEMALLMSASDLLVTKAGPGTLHDAYLAGLPIILSGAIPGQEDGNVSQILGSGAGIWSPEPASVALLVETLFREDDARLSDMAARSRSLARPHAAEIAAREIWREIESARNRPGQRK